MAIKKKPANGRKVVKKIAARPKKKVASKPRRVAAKKKVVKSIGRVTHFFREIKVAVVKFSKPTKRGSEVQFRGATTDFKQKLDSLQYDHKPVATAPKGKEVGVKVKKRVRAGDMVYPG